jgi:hypothetical protein
MVPSLHFPRVLAATTVVAVAAGAFMLAPTGAVDAYYSHGVKSMTFDWANDHCEPGQALPCTPGAGVGDANVLRVTQSKVGPGQWAFTDLSGTATDSDNLWLAADIAAECRTGYKLFQAQVDTGTMKTAPGWYDAPEAGVWVQEVPVPNAKSMPEKRIAINLPIVDEGEFVAPIAYMSSPADVLAAGEAEIARRVADGMAETEARALAWELNTTVRLRGEVVCRGNHGLHLKRRLDRELHIPLTVVFEPYVAPVGEMHGVANDLALPQVTSAHLTVSQYEQGGECSLVLLGTIGTNMATTVEYRFVNQYGQPSNTYSVQIDDSGIGFVQHEVAIPTLDTPDPQQDLAPLLGGGGPSQGLVDVDTTADEQYSGTYELQILTPNQMSDVDGFNVDYCAGVVSGEFGGSRGFHLQRG